MTYNYKYARPAPSWGAIARYATDTVGKYAYNYAKRKASEYVTQQFKKPRYSRAGRTTHGVMAGKLRRKMRPARRVVRRKRYGRRVVSRSYRRRIPKMNQYGVCIQRETTGTITDDKCIYLTHSTASASDILFLLTQLWMKKVLAVSGFSVDDFIDSRTAYIPNGHSFTFVYKPSSNNAPTGVTYVVAAIDTSYALMADSMRLAILAAITAGSITEASIPVEFQYVGTGGVIHRINLLDNLVTYYAKATLKMQNRSVAAAGDDEQDVNNVPLNGKMYAGMGNGPILRGRENTFFFANYLSGVSPFSSATLTSIQEPVDASEFTNCSRYNKLYINPGGIKTSVLFFKSNIQLVNLWHKLVSFYATGVTFYTSLTKFELGRYHTIALERVIGKLASEATPGITVTYEHDVKSWIDMKKVQNYTTPLRVVE